MLLHLLRRGACHCAMLCGQPPPAHYRGCCFMDVECPSLSPCSDCVGKELFHVAPQVANAARNMCGFKPDCCCCPKTSSAMGCMCTPFVATHFVQVSRTTAGMELSLEARLSRPKNTSHLNVQVTGTFLSAEAGAQAPSLPCKSSAAPPAESRLPVVRVLQSERATIHSAALESPACLSGAVSSALSGAAQAESADWYCCISHQCCTVLACGSCAS